MQETVDTRAEALFTAGKHTEAAQVQAEALRGLPERLENRSQRNSWATGAVNAYAEAFSVDRTRCAAANAGLAVADEYLATLMAVYGAQVATSDEYTGMQRLRSELEEARARHDCPTAEAAAPEPAPASAATEAVGPAPAPARGSRPADVPSAKPRTAGLTAGLGISAALTVGMTIVSVLKYTQLRKPNGRYYDAIMTAAVESGIDTGVRTNMCESAAGDVADACGVWSAQKRLFIATTVLSGVLAVSTAVFTGLLIHKRRQPGPTAGLLRRHQPHLGAVPQRGGATVTAGFRF